jgi:hypothetical protein
MPALVRDFLQFKSGRKMVSFQKFTRLCSKYIWHTIHQPSGQATGETWDISIAAKEFCAGKNFDKCSRRMYGPINWESRKRFGLWFFHVGRRCKRIPYRGKNEKMSSRLENWILAIQWVYLCEATRMKANPEILTPLCNILDKGPKVLYSLKKQFLFCRKI